MMKDDLGNLGALANPRSIMVVGASSNIKKYPGKVLNHLIKFGYTGRIHLVNPKRDEIMGLPCYPDIASVPEPVDVALLLVAAKKVPEALHEAVAAGCRSAVVFSSGMAETGDPGGQLQGEIGRIGRQAGIRILGPNCLGYANVAASTVMSGAAAFQRDDLVAGQVGIAMQSGGIMGSVVDRAWSERIGVSHAFSTGNEADIDIADCIAFLAKDDKTSVIALFVETVRNVERFRKACALAMQRGKPVIALKVGRSEGARRVALSHTAALTGNGAAYDALFRKLGVITVEDLDDLFHLANTLARLPIPAGPRLAIAGTSGGLASLLSDLASDAGLPLAELQPETLTRIAELQQGFGGADNPLDITGHVVSDENWWMVRHILGLLLDDPGVDMLIFGQPTSHFSQEAATDIVDLVADAKKPVFPVWIGRQAVGPAIAHVRAANIPVFEQPAACIRAASGVLRYAKLRCSPAPRGNHAVVVDRQRRDRARALMAGADGPLSEASSNAILALYGLQVPEHRVVRTADDAIAAARVIGAPVALKVHGPQFRHKSDVGGVHLNLRSDEDIAAAYDDIVRAAKSPEMLVAQMVPPGFELILGLSRDAQIGLTLMVGMGGIFAEIFDDAALEVAPLADGDAQRMLARLRGAALLDGARGTRPCDRAAVIAAIDALSQMALEIGDLVEELDINPLIVSPDGAWAADALIVARPGTALKESSKHKSEKV